MSFKSIEPGSGAKYINLIKSFQTWNYGIICHTVRQEVRNGQPIIRQSKPSLFKGVAETVLTCHCVVKNPYRSVVGTMVP